MGFAQAIRGIAPESEPAGLIDGHAHVFHRALPMSPGRRYTPDHDASLETYLDLLRRHGVTGAVLVQPSFLGSDNSHLLQVLQASRQDPRMPDLHGVAVVDPLTPLAVLRAMRDIGVVGLRLNLVQQYTPEFEAPAWEAFFSAVEVLDWTIELHIEGPRLPDVLPALLERCSSLVVDHFGLPDPVAPLRCAGFRRLLKAPPGRIAIKASAPYRVFPGRPLDRAARDCAPLYRALADALGDDALVWGSDWSWTQNQRGQSYADTLDWYRAWRDEG